MRRFAELTARQVGFFREDHADLIEACAVAERAYDGASRDEAEERYAEYLDLVEEGAAVLTDIRDTYAATLDPDFVAEYEAAFEREVRKRLPQFAVAL